MVQVTVTVPVPSIALRRTPVEPKFKGAALTAQMVALVADTVNAAVVAWLLPIVAQLPTVE